MTSERMPCRITDGGSLSPDSAPKDYFEEKDTTDERRQERTDIPLTNRIDIAIRKMTKSNYIDFSEHLRLLQDCRRMLEQVE